MGCHFLNTLKGSPDVNNFERSRFSGHYMYHQFTIHKFYALPTQCIYVFCVDLRTAIISLYSIN